MCVCVHVRSRTCVFVGSYRQDCTISTYMHSCTYICAHYHHHRVVPLAPISLTLSRHFSLSFIASGRSSELHPVSSHSCCMYVLAGRPAFARPYVGVHRSIYVHTGRKEHIVSHSPLDWFGLMDFNGMSNHMGLFYV